MINNKDRELFVETITSEFMNRISGSEVKRLVGQRPEEAFMVGKLYSASKEDEFSSKKDITQMQIDFFIDEDELDDAHIELIPRGDFYYRTIPSYNEQKVKLLNQMRALRGNTDNFRDFEDVKEFFKDGKDFELSKIDLEYAYEKLSISDEEFITSLHIGRMKFDDGVSSRIFEAELTNEIDKKVESIWQSDSKYYQVRDEITFIDLKDEISFNSFLDKYKTKEVPKPIWSIKIEVKLKKTENNGVRISLSLLNTTPNNESNFRRGNQPFSEILFNAGLTIKLNGAHPIKIDSKFFADDYKYNYNQYAITSNTSYTYDEVENMFTTENIPMAKQMKLKTKNHIQIKFSDLVNDPVPELERISIQMDKELVNMENKFSNIRSTLKGIYKEQYEREISAFKMEVKRFKQGIFYLKTKDLALRAFKSMNEVFVKTAKGYDSWRLFQIVFIVSLIADVIVSEYGENEIDNSNIDVVDLLYFPTGGGKTEAFFGITLFTLFFDRARDKRSGISAIIKYPLRLLSIQQVDRLSGLLATAELIRSKDKFYSGDRFSIGYYVGDRNTPNKIKKESIEELNKMNQVMLDEKYRIIDVCPFCGEQTIYINFNEENHRLEHRCSNERCESEGLLPLYIVDSEIFRYLPSVLVSTIDKITAIGLQSNFRNLFGEVEIECPKHGYSSKKDCVEKYLCDVDALDFKDVSIKDGAPTLLIQDEVHLIREALGTFDAHYETLFDFFIKDLSKFKKKTKIIGATATISEYEKQIKHLYYKEAVRFPCEVPSIKENFYSYIDNKELNRIFIGFAPFGKAIINAVVYSMKNMREIVYDYYINPKKILEIPDISIDNIDEAQQMVKDYWIFLQYNNVKFDSNKVLGAIDSPINPELKELDIPVFEARKMTGDDTFQEVRKVLKEIEMSRDGLDEINLISATSMISHGVDASKFNIMFFFGMPGNTAEYIQAYSRSGRSFPGLIIDIFRPTRERDNSYLKNFVDFHKYKDILVEQVPINRWASRAIVKTFPGIVSAVLINYYDKELLGKYGPIFNLKVLKKVVMNKDIDLEILKDQLVRIYHCDESDLGKYYKEFIDTKVKELFERIIDYPIGEDYIYFPMEIKKFGIGLNNPMNSLRDTGKNVNIEMG